MKKIILLLILLSPILMFGATAREEEEASRETIFQSLVLLAFIVSIGVWYFLVKSATKSEANYKLQLKQTILLERIVSGINQEVTTEDIKRLHSEIQNTDYKPESKGFN